MQMGGVPKVLIDIVRNLDPEKFEPFIVTDLYQGELIDEIPGNIQVFSISHGRQEMSSLFPIRLVQLALRNLKVSIYRLFPILYRRKIDIIPDIEVAILHSSLREMLKSPFKNSQKVCWFHTDVKWHHTIDEARKIARGMLSCDANVFVSKSTLETMEELLQARIPNSHYIYNTFNAGEILKKAAESLTSPLEKEIMARENLMVSVGRLCHAKGYDMLIQVHAELMNEGVFHHIAVVGDGTDFQKLQKMIRRLGVQDSFFLLGSRLNPYPYMLAAKCYIQPSRYEAYPLAVGEALILNKPLISTMAGGIPELIIHRKTGLLCQFNKNALKRTISEMLYNPRLRRDIRKHEREFDAEAHNKKIYCQINTLMEELLLR